VGANLYRDYTRDTDSPLFDASHVTTHASQAQAGSPRLWLTYPFHHYPAIVPQVYERLEEQANLRHSHTQHSHYSLQERCDFQPLTGIADLAVFYHEWSAAGRNGENEDEIVHSSRRRYFKHVDTTFINEPPSD
jgi:hypothetical protein